MSTGALVHVACIGPKNGPAQVSFAGCDMLDNSAFVPGRFSGQQRLTEGCTVRLHRHMVHDRCTVCSAWFGSGNRI